MWLCEKWESEYIIKCFIYSTFVHKRNSQTLAVRCLRVNKQQYNWLFLVQVSRLLVCNMSLDISTIFLVQTPAWVYNMKIMQCYTHISIAHYDIIFIKAVHDLIINLRYLRLRTWFQTCHRLIPFKLIKAKLYG